MFSMQSTHALQRNCIMMSVLGSLAFVGVFGMELK